jgi:hypothetical protein
MTSGQPPPVAPRTLLDALLRVSFCRIDEVFETGSGDPRHIDAQERDPDRPRRMAAVAAAYHRSAGSDGSPLLLGWCRPHAGGQVTVLTTADAAGATGPAALTFPPGSRGRPFPASAAMALLDRLPSWTRIGAVVDALLLEHAVAPHEDGARPGLVDGLLGAWHAAFGWLLVAAPVPAAEIGAEASRVATEEREARSRGSSPEYAVRATRLTHRHRELRSSESTGLWRVHLLAGGTDPADAMAVAGLLISAFDLTGLPYALVPAPVRGDLAAVLGASGAGTPFLADSRMVAALARTPAVEIPGIRVVPRPVFDVTPEVGPEPIVGGPDDPAPSGIELGEIVDRDGLPAGRLRLPLASLNRHTFVCGATGSGKSQTIRYLLAQATAAGIPWLVIEPAKAEYRRMAARRPDADVTVLRPGEPLVPPVGFNPLAPVPGFPLQTHADLTRALFVAAFRADEPFPQVLAAALTRSYETLGWDLTLSSPAHAGVQPRYPTLADLEVVAREVVETIGYGPEVTADVRGFMAVRLASLRLGTTGRIFEASLGLDLDRLLHRNVVFEIEDVGDDRDKAFLMGAVLIQVVEHLRVRDRRSPHTGGLRHLTVLEEAHRLLRRPDQSGPAAHAVELFAALLAEVRAYGEGLVIAEQIPTKLVSDVIKNTAIKIVHRMPARDDRDSVGATMNLSDAQSRYLITLSPGTGAVFTDGMDHPVLATVPDGTASERGDARTASPATLVLDVPPTCSPVCHAGPCTLQQTTSARRLLVDDPRLPVWVELAVLGHLIGLPAPAPSGRFAAAVAGMEARLLGCAVRHAVDAAVASRSAALSSSHSPVEFASHVAAELRGTSGRPAACPDEPLRWLAPCYRWNPVQIALQDRCAREPQAGRHPHSQRWEATYGEEIPGNTCREQLDAVRRRSHDLQGDRRTVIAVIFGHDDPSALERAIGRSRDDAGLSSAIDRALTDFTVVRGWPKAFLAPRSGRSS